MAEGKASPGVLQLPAKRFKQSAFQLTELTS
jgi:hypothetical protein